MATMRYAARAANLNTAVHVAPHASQISLGGGYAFPEMLPDISKAAAEIARKYRTSTLQYGPLKGLPELRDEIVRFVADDGVSATRDNILVLNGAKNGLDLALRLFVEKGDGIVVSKPNYATALHIFRNHEASFIEIDMDEEGMRTDLLENTLQEMQTNGATLPKLLYIVPDFHNPTGITLSLHRRRRLVELAEEYNFVILEDEPYRRIKFTGDSIAPIQAFDTNGRVIGLGTFSKIFAPGIRVGWANASVDIINRMAAMKSDGGCSPFAQQIVTEMLKTGEIARHTKELSVELERHRDAMVDALAKYLPEAKFSVSRGGYYLWVELPQGLDCDVLAAEAEASGVTIFSGRPYFADRKPGNFIRLAYSNSTPTQIDQGIKILSEVIRRLHNSAGSALTQSAAVQHFD
jgi:2-aminoadipate transaminase